MLAAAKFPLPKAWLNCSVNATCWSGVTNSNVPGRVSTEYHVYAPGGSIPLKVYDTSAASYAIGTMPRAIGTMPGTMLPPSCSDKNCPVGNCTTAYSIYGLGW